MELQIDKLLKFSEFKCPQLLDYGTQITDLERKFGKLVVFDKMRYIGLSKFTRHSDPECRWCPGGFNKAFVNVVVKPITDRPKNIRSELVCTWHFLRVFSLIAFILQASILIQLRRNKMFHLCTWRQYGKKGKWFVRNARRKRVSETKLKRIDAARWCEIFRPTPEKALVWTEKIHFQRQVFGNLRASS